MFVNRDRADPQTALAPCIDGGGCPDSECYEMPLPPLAYDPRLGHSARLQPTILAENNVTLMHPSPCLLNPDIGKTYPDECDGGTDCVCQTPVQCSNPPDTDHRTGRPPGPRSASAQGDPRRQRVGRRR